MLVHVCARVVCETLEHSFICTEYVQLVAIYILMITYKVLKSYVLINFEIILVNRFV